MIDLSTLTDIENMVLALSMRGLKNREIAKSRGVCVKTVEAQLKSLYEKTGIHGKKALCEQVWNQLDPQLVEKHRAS